MKIIALITNISVLVTTVGLFFVKGLRGIRPEGIFLIGLVIVAVLIVNIVALSRMNGVKDLLSLFLERKRLEQEKKILDLKKQLGKEN
jgi:hypothetical protein